MGCLPGYHIWNILFFQFWVFTHASQASYQVPKTMYLLVARLAPKIVTVNAFGASLCLGWSLWPTQPIKCSDMLWILQLDNKTLAAHYWLFRMLTDGYSLWEASCHSVKNPSHVERPSVISWSCPTQVWVIRQLTSAVLNVSASWISAQSILLMTLAPESTQWNLHERPQTKKHPAELSVSTEPTTREATAWYFKTLSLEIFSNVID